MRILIALSLLFAACSSGPQVKQQQYAKLPDQRFFEYDFPTVWSGLEGTFKQFPVVERDPNKVDEKEMRELSQRKLKTDWIYTTSRDKYQEYKANGIPKKKYLQSRVKYEVVAKSALGGVNVSIRATEEVEKLKPDGLSAGYSGAEKVDSSRSAELLDKLQNQIHLNGGQPGQDF